jgi:hypothetical protein
MQTVNPLPAAQRIEAEILITLRAYCIRGFYAPSATGSQYRDSNEIAAYSKAQGIAAV